MIDEETRKKMEQELACTTADVCMMSELEISSISDRSSFIFLD